LSGRCRLRGAAADKDWLPVRARALTKKAPATTPPGLRKTARDGWRHVSRTRSLRQIVIAAQCPALLSRSCACRRLNGAGLDEDRSTDPVSQNAATTAAANQFVKKKSARPCASCAGTVSRRRSSCSRATTPIPTPSSASNRAPTIMSLSPSVRASRSLKLLIAIASGYPSTW
jgi:hypothetical protein